MGDGRERAGVAREGEATEACNAAVESALVRTRDGAHAVRTSESSN